MKLGVFSLSLFNPESIYSTEAHTHFPYNIKYTLSTPPHPQILQNCCFTDVSPCYSSCSKRTLQFFLEGSQTRCIYGNMQFFKVIPSLYETFHFN